MKRPKPQQHWTEKSIEDYQSRITFDFVSQVDDRLDLLPMSRAALARALGLTESAVSQALNNQARLTLSNIIKYTRGVGLKVAIVTYDDSDPANLRGPISADIFTRCWESMGKPLDFFEYEEKTQQQALDRVELAAHRVAPIPEAKYDYAFETPQEMWPKGNTSSKIIRSSNTEQIVRSTVGEGTHA